MTALGLDDVDALRERATGAAGEVLLGVEDVLSERRRVDAADLASDGAHAVLSGARLRRFEVLEHPGEAVAGARFDGRRRRDAAPWLAM